jgi:hypothetical protein
MRGVEAPDAMLACLCSLVSPLLCPVVLVYFLFAYVMWRNSVMYLNVRKYESGGSLWPHVFDRLVVCLLIFQLFMTSLMLVKKAYYQGILLLLTVPIMLKKFHRWVLCGRQVVLCIRREGEQ